MVEGVVEVVEGFALRVVRGDGAVSGVEGCGERAAEEFEHGEVGFRVAEVGCGVEDDAGVVGEGGGVAGPEVAVEQGGCGVVVGEQAVGGCEDIGLGEVVAVVAGEPELGAEPLVAVEGGPGWGGGVRLGGGADEVVVVEAVGRGCGGVEGGELAAEVMPRAGGERVEVEPFECDPAGGGGCFAIADEGGDAGVGGEQGEGAGLGC